MRKLLLALAAAALVAAPGAALAANQTSALMSPKCDADKLKKLAGDALVKIGPNASGAKNIYDVTLDTAKMKFSALTQKMIKAGCF